MTVCIAARSGNVVVAACDRMLTAGDVKFETSASVKLQPFSALAFIMTAGDAALSAELVHEAELVVRQRIFNEPNNIWTIKDIVNVYITKYNEARNRRIEAQILSPLGMSYAYFLQNQKNLSESLVSDRSKELINYSMPSTACIIAGVDTMGSHIYSVIDDYYNCDDSVGFAAIGSGSRHALSQLMMSRHSYNTNLPETILSVYVAKKRSEIAPGVGQFTDLVWVGGGLQLTWVDQKILNRLEAEYQTIYKAERKAFEKGRKEISAYVEKLAQGSFQSGTGGVSQESVDSKGNQGGEADNGGKG